MSVNESRSFGSAMAVVDADVSSGGRREHLTLILKARIGLNHRDRVISAGVRLQFRLPEQTVAARSAS